MKKLLLLALSTILIISCSKEDENPSGFSGDVSTIISGDEGTKLDLTLSDGSKEGLNGTSVSGWANGSLLDGNYWKQLRISAGDHVLAFRINIPKNKKFADIVEGKHELSGLRLRLENTRKLEGVIPELYFSFSKDDRFDDQINLTGNMIIKRDHSIVGTNYDIVGEINANYNSMSLKGYFWAEKVDW